MAPDTVILDEDGDLILIVGGDEDPDVVPTVFHIMPSPPTSFQVCSRALSRTSPVFKAMLNGPFKESRSNNTFNTNDWVVELPSDNPESFGVLLHIIHSNFDVVPNSVDLLQLFQILVAANKYDMVRIIRHFLSVWFDVNKQWLWPLPTVPDLQLLVQVSYELGVESIFREAVISLALHCELKDGEADKNSWFIWDTLYFRPPSLKCKSSNQHLQSVNADQMCK